MAIQLNSVKFNCRCDYGEYCHLTIRDESRYLRDQLSSQKSVRIAELSLTHGGGGQQATNTPIPSPTLATTTHRAYKLFSKSIALSTPDRSHVILHTDITNRSVTIGKREQQTSGIDHQWKVDILQVVRHKHADKHYYRRRVRTLLRLWNSRPFKAISRQN